MKEHRWTQVLLAAVIIAIAGCVIAVAETVDVEVEVDTDASTTVEVKTDDGVNVFTLDDLIDGEERVIESNGHAITVRRSGDEITVLMDGEALDGGDDAVIRKMILIAVDEDETDGTEKKIVMIGGHHGNKIIKCDHDGMISYRCEETGSMLLVDPEYATRETLVDPASGCLMTKVANEEPEVIMIKKIVTVIDED